MRLDPSRRAFGAGMAGLAVAGLTGACGTSEGATPSGGGLEKTKLKVGTIPVPPAAPVYVAIKHGLFKAEGLDVQAELFQGGAAAFPKIAAGALDIVYSGNMGVILAQAKGLKMRILSECDIAVPRQFPIAVPPNSPIRNVQDLKGKRIAINLKRNLAELAVLVAMKVNNIDVVRDKVTMVEVGFPDMPRALKNRDVDAAWLVEPALTLAEQTGVRRVVETMEGPLASLPLTLFAATDPWVKKNPNTARAFQRAINKALVMSIQNREAVYDILPTFTQIDRKLASVVGYSGFVTTTNPVRLQRVSDLMVQFGFLKKAVDVKPMIF
jgi:NitT/TauT family transport system substrate-binding protein